MYSWFRRCAFQTCCMFFSTEMCFVYLPSTQNLKVAQRPNVPDGSKPLQCVGAQLWWEDTEGMHILWNNRDNLRCFSFSNKAIHLRCWVKKPRKYTSWINHSRIVVFVSDRCIKQFISVNKWKYWNIIMTFSAMSVIQPTLSCYVLIWKTAQWALYATWH